MDNVLITELGFQKYSTKTQVYYCGWLPKGDCIEVIVNDKIEVNFVNTKNNYARLCQFKKEVDLQFLKMYLSNLVLVFA